MNVSIFFQQNPLTEWEAFGGWCQLTTLQRHLAVVFETMQPRSLEFRFLICRDCLLLSQKVMLVVLHNSKLDYKLQLLSQLRLRTAQETTYLLKSHWVILWMRMNWQIVWLFSLEAKVLQGNRLCSRQMKKVMN